MLIHVFPICTTRGIWSFRPQPGTTPVQVRVPKGSVLREVRGMGSCMSTLLFVPNPDDDMLLGGWPANAVWREAMREGGRFRVVARPRKADTCQI